jgi:type I restriction enzyme R subunit
VLADLVALVRYAVQSDGELAPYPEQVQARYQRWLAQQEADNRSFTPEQHWWRELGHGTQPGDPEASGGV